MGKSRVVPKRFVSIPRLELTAAVLSVKNDMFVEERIGSWRGYSLFLDR